ncbi:MAG: HU family DNA-binding protein [Clostridia bacterium]|nr:HU family DNA-binding protein [Clostridia bacterium]
MNKATLIAKVAQAKGLSKKETEEIFNAFLDTIVDTVNSGEKVQLVGFGTFEVKTRAGRICKVPGTNVEVTVPDSKIPTFKAGKVFKEKVR